MRKTKIIIVGILALCCLFGCAEKPKPKDTVQPPTRNWNNIATNAEELSGYRYVVPRELELNRYAESTVLGCGECDVLVFTSDTIPFKSWDTVIEDCEEDWLRVVSDLLGDYPHGQKITGWDREKSPNGEDFLYAEGILYTPDGNKEYNIYYHVVDDEYIRFFAGIVNDESRGDMQNIMQCIADNLIKV